MRTQIIMVQNYNFTKTRDMIISSTTFPYKSIHTLGYHQMN